MLSKVEAKCELRCLPKPGGHLLFKATRSRFVLGVPEHGETLEAVFAAEGVGVRRGASPSARSSTSAAGRERIVVISIFADARKFLVTNELVSHEATSRRNLDFWRHRELTYRLFLVARNSLRREPVDGLSCEDCRVVLLRLQPAFLAAANTLSAYWCLVSFFVRWHWL